jgi:hypothetical protein
VIGVSPTIATTGVPSLVAVGIGGSGAGGFEQEVKARRTAQHASNPSQEQALRRPRATKKVQTEISVPILSIMPATLSFSVPAQGELARFKLPAGVQKRLAELLDRQDSDTTLTAAERREAEGLVEMAEFLSLLKLQATRPAKRKGS